MIEELGRVVAVDEHSAWIQMQRAGACGACATKKGCGAANLARFFGDRHTRVQVAKVSGVRAGDEVVLGLPEKALLHGAAWLYGVPLAMFVVGAALGELFARTWSIRGDGMSVLLACAGLLVGLWVARRWSLNAPLSSQYQPVILRTVTEKDKLRPVVIECSEINSQKG